jgi:hypothetical protein
MNMTRANQNKTGRTINFDNIVLVRIDELVKKEKTTASAIVNRIVRQAIMDDEEYYRSLSKEYWLKFQEAQYLKEQAIIKKRNI